MGLEGDRGEADVPAQETQAPAHPWIPGPDADPGRAERAAAQTAEGPQAARGLGAQATQRRRLRPWPTLRNVREFQTVYREGRRFGGEFVVVYRRERPGPTRVGIAVGRRLGKAVVRNRVRRRIREILRMTPLGPDQEVVVVARSSAGSASWRALRTELGALLEQSGAVGTPEGRDGP